MAPVLSLMCRYARSVHGLLGGFGPVLIKISITGALLAYVFFRVDFGALASVLESADAGKFSLAVAVLFLSYVLGGLRWWSVIKGLGQNASARSFISLFWIGGLVGQVLP